MSWRSAYSLPTVPNGLIGKQVTAFSLNPTTINPNGDTQIYQFPELETGLYIVEGHIALDLSYTGTTNVIEELTADVGGNETVLVAVPTFIPQFYPTTTSRFFYTNTLVITDDTPQIVTLHTNSIGITFALNDVGSCVATKIA
jgi:hypothetical protein